MTERWFGIHKLTEEAGELLQVIGKINAFPEGDHPDGNGDLIARLNEELTDLEAAVKYFRVRNDLKDDRNRYLDKLNKFNRWGLPGTRG